VIIIENSSFLKRMLLLTATLAEPARSKPVKAA
jgi:hypothetical protein